MTSLFNKMAEDFQLGSTADIINIHNNDSGNGDITSFLSTSLPFLLKKSFDSYYSLEIVSLLGRK